jgi:hypothetical protein
VTSTHAQRVGGPKIATVKRLEFWPDYGGVLLHANGRSVALDDLGLGPDLVTHAQDWVSRYDDAKVDPAGWDEAWVNEGRAIFQELRETLALGGFAIFDWEGLWSGSAENGPAASDVGER